MSMLTFSTHKYNKIREVGFNVLGKEFKLLLSPKQGLLHPRFKVTDGIFQSGIISGFLKAVRYLKKRVWQL